MATRTIKDHSFFGGKGSPAFPMGNKVKTETSGERAGGINDYPCFSEDIKRTQDANASLVKKHAQKRDHRN